MGPHDGEPADLHPQHALAEHHPQAGRAGLVEDGLALDPQRYLPVEVLVAADVRPGPEYRAGVSLGLQQAGHHHRLEVAQPGGIGLQPDIGLEPRRKHRAVGVPPALAPRVPGQLHQQVRLGAGHAVDLQQLPNVAGTGADPPGLQAADPGARALQPLPDVLAG